MKKIHLCLIGITTLFLTACTVGTSSNRYIDKGNPTREADSIAPLTVTFDFNGGTYDSKTTVTFDNVKPTTYFRYVKERLTETITPPEHYGEVIGYSFSSDDKDNLISNDYVIKENITVYAQYEISDPYCTVNWKDGETSETITTETYFKNDMPKFKGTIPYHDDITFNHWEPAIHAITQEDIAKGTIDYKAIYIPIKTIYTVTLNYDDGSEQPMHTQTVLNGKCAVEPKITKEDYKLDKWEYTSGETGTFDFSTPITKNIEIKAHWVKATYTVTWLDCDGTLIKKEEVEDGGSPTKPSDPKGKSSPCIEYTFNNWVPSVSEEVHSNQTYVATYQIHFYKNLKIYMHIDIVDSNKDFSFTCAGTSNITVDWGDGSPQECKPVGTLSHTYKTADEYYIRILGPITTISGVTSDDKSLIKDLYFGKDITSIGNSAFRGCSQLQTVTFEEGSKLTSIGELAFRGCSVLTKITIPSGVKSIGAQAFHSCSQLKTVTFAGESELASISDFAFYNCSALTNITIPSSVTSIGDSAFYNCSAFTNITIPSGVTSIAGSAFSSCSQLQTVTFGEGSQLKSIDTFAFYNCSALTNITIPSSVTSIGDAAFSGCSQLQTVDLTTLNTPPTLGIRAFDNCSSDLKLYVKPELVEAFKAAPGWSSYADNIVPGPVPSIN